MATTPLHQLVGSFLSSRARVHARRSDAWLDRQRQRDYAVSPYWDQPDHVPAVQEARDMGRQLTSAQEAATQFDVYNSSSEEASSSSSSSEDEDEARVSNSEEDVYSDNESVTDDSAAVPALRWK